MKNLLLLFIYTYFAVFIYILISNLYINTVKLPYFLVKIIYVLNSFITIYLGIHNILKNFIKNFNFDLNDYPSVGYIQNVYSLFDIDRHGYTSIICTYMCTYLLFFCLVYIYFYYKTNIKQKMLDEIKKQEMKGVTFKGNKTIIKIKVSIYIFMCLNPVLIKFSSFTIFYIMWLVIQFVK